MSSFKTLSMNVFQGTAVVKDNVSRLVYLSEASRIHDFLQESVAGASVLGYEF